MKKIFKKKYTYEITTEIKYYLSLWRVKKYTDQITDVTAEDYFSEDEEALETFQHVCEKYDDDMNGMINYCVDLEINEVQCLLNHLIQETDTTISVSVEAMWYAPENDRYLITETVTLYPDAKFLDECIPNINNMYSWADKGLARMKYPKAYDMVAVNFYVDNERVYREILKITSTTKGDK